MASVQWYWTSAGVAIILLFRPLFLLCFKRGALFLMLSKSIVSLVYIFVRLVQIQILAMKSADLDLWNSICLKSMNQLSLCIKLHISLLALNRLHAMFWPMTYTKWWLKKRTYFRIWLILCPASCAIYFSLISFAKIHGTVLSMIPLFFDTIVPSICYGLLLIRILKERTKAVPRREQTNSGGGTTVLEKDRIRMCVVFFSSSIPHSISAANSALQYLFPGYNSDPVFSEALMIIFVLSNGCVEEFVLLLLCRDFRILLKQQFIDFISYWTCRGLNSANAVVPIETITVNQRTGSRVSAWNLRNC